jgi:hypothetical protein
MIGNGPRGDLLFAKKERVQKKRHRGTPDTGKGTTMRLRLVIRSWPVMSQPTLFLSVCRHTAQSA